MKRAGIFSVGLWSVLALSVLLLNQCRNNIDSAYKRIREHADNIKVINTHEHQHWTEEIPANNFRFYQLLASSYLAGDVTSAGAGGFDMKLIDSLGLDDLWNRYEGPLNYTRNTSYYSQFVRGFKKLYDFDDLYFTRENVERLSTTIEKNYKDYKSWFKASFTRAGYDLMFLDQYWKPFNTEVDTDYYALVFHINPLISESSKRPEKGALLKSIYKKADNAGFKINNLDDYLRFCDYLFIKNTEKNAVCIKNSQAYSRSLYYEDVPYDETRILFDKPSASLTPAEAKKIEDFMFHWIIKQAIKYGLPIQIHTGYLAGNGNTLDNGQPVRLNNLFLLYPEAKFDLFHGGFPWTGEFTALGKMFPNVYLNLVWLPQISREEAVNALDVMLDCVPYNKFLWGGDCDLIEESAGSLEYGKDVVSEVLAKRIERGLLTEEIAFDIVDRIFRQNAIDVFNLENR